MLSLFEFSGNPSQHSAQELRSFGSTRFRFASIRPQKRSPTVLSIGTRSVWMSLCKHCGDTGNEIKSRMSGKSCTTRAFVEWRESCVLIWRLRCEQEGPGSLRTAAPAESSARTRKAFPGTSPVLRDGAIFVSSLEIEFS